jgi:hypothetical protein
VARLYDLVLWALHPRPIYPQLVRIEPTMTAEELREAARALPVGREAPGRWLIDLQALRSGGAAAHEPLLRLDG